MEEKDRQLLDLMQERFPLAERPYRALGERLDVTEEEVLRRVAALKHVGIVRRIGATFDPRKLGYVSSLVACRVPAGRVDEFARVVNAYPEVTHNYERDHEVNVWFTIIAPSEERVAQILEEVKQRTGIRDVYNLPATRLHKISVTFPVATEGPEDPSGGGEET
jgi:DNA-binding Lrp family transcriptional regulator